MSQNVSTENRTSVSSKAFLDDKNLGRQAGQSKTHIFPRTPGELGALMIAQASWISSLATVHQVAKQYVDSRENLTVPVPPPRLDKGEEFFPELSEPQAVDMGTYLKIQALLNAPYRSIDFPPPDES